MFVIVYICIYVCVCVFVCVLYSGMLEENEVFKMVFFSFARYVRW